jgi:RIO kinase 1
MRIPDSLTSLADEGIIEEVVRPLMSGKEAQIYLVRSGGELRVAKVYKQAQDRSFKQRAEYTEGRSVRNSRDQRAMTKRTRHGRAQDEAAWRSAEVDMIYRLRAAGVRVPVPHQFVDGVLVMELVKDAQGNPAPRLGDVKFEREEVKSIFQHLLAEVVRKLAAGVVHGDLSDFNVLLGADGPVIIDLPQAVDAAGNNHAKSMLERDVRNLTNFFGQYAPELLNTEYAKEIWSLYESGALTPEAKLSGCFEETLEPVDLGSVVREIDDARAEEAARRIRMAE